MAICVDDFGAAGGDLNTDSRAAIQAAVDCAIAQGGGVVTFRNVPYRVNGPISIGGNLYLSGSGPASKLVQYTDNAPIIQVDKAPLNSGWKLLDLTLSYNSPQIENEEAVGVVLSVENKISYMWEISGVNISNAYRGIDLPQLAGCHSFLGKISNTRIANCSNVGVSIKGDTSGANTNLTLENVWVYNTEGSEIAGSRGFHLSRIDGLRLENVGCDHVQGEPFFLESVRGEAGNLWAESCDLASSGSAVALLRASGAQIYVGSFHAIGNAINIAGAADCYLIYANSSSRLSVGVFEDRANGLTDTSSGAYYTTNTDATSRLDVQNYRYTAHASLPAPNANHADFQIIKQLRSFDGNERTAMRGGKLHTYGTSPPISGLRSKGDIQWNTDPVAGGYLGWTCVTSGTPGEWRGFAQIAPT